MLNTVLGTKSHMAQAFTLAGHRVPVSVVKVGENTVTQIKTPEKEGYWALQLTLGSKKAKNTSKPLQGHFKKANFQDKNLFPRYVKEVRVDEADKNVGDKIKAGDVFKAGDLVQVTGISKGKGFAGVVKRWGFAGGPKTHGQSDRHRAPGSIGQGTTPGRVYKGKKMGGHMGVDQVTVKNLTVLKVDSKEGTVWLSGPVPGNREGLLIITKIGENKHFQDLYSKDIPEEVVIEAMEAAAEEEAANKPVVEEEAPEGEEKEAKAEEAKE
jgi:large subunit ribosomal protein L3